MSKIALITGVTGQDGSYLAEYLLSLGYEVHGLIRKASTFNTKRIDHLIKDPHQKEVSLFLHYGELTDFSSLTSLISRIEPDEIYNLGAQSHVKVSFDLPIYTGSVTGLGALCIVEAIRRADINCRFYQASSSEMFGSSTPPQNEDSGFYPRSPYAVAKLYAYWTTINYREAYGIFACNGILFNHESPRRGETFLTRKITRAISNILAEKQKKLYLGNLKAKRDWGYAPEYIMGMHKILQYSKPEDFVLGTGKSISVRDYLEMAFSYADLDWRDYVEVDQRYFRPTEVDHLQADPSKAKKVLNWNSKIEVNDLVRIMIDYELECQGIKDPDSNRDFLKQNELDWLYEPIFSQ